MRTFPDSLIRDIVRGEPLVRLALRDWQHPFRACTPTVRWHFQSMKKSKMQKHATPSGQKRAGTQRSVARTPADFAEEMVQAYALNDRMNQLVGASRSTRLAGQALGQRNANDSCLFYSRS